MVGLKRFFHSGASPNAGVTPNVTVSRDTSSPCPSNEAAFHPSSSPITPVTPALPDLNQHFEGIERQFEELHESFYTRTVSSLRQFRYHGSKSPSPSRSSRHVDVIEALFSGHRYRMSPISLSPSTPYNEDVADRNLHTLPKLVSTSPGYASTKSTLYQEDVADRNMTASPSSQLGSRSHSSTIRSDSSRGRGSKPASRGRYTGSSQLHSRPSSETRTPSIVVASSPTSHPPLKPQASEPDIRSIHIRTPDLASFPRPPTSSGPRALAERATTHVPSVPNTTGLKPEHGERRSSVSKRPGLARAGSSKNVLDLSIDTGITASKKPSIKIEHRVIQPPTPNKLTVPQAASIAEIVNSPLPAGTPSPFAPEFPHGYNADEIMNMFKQAYISTQVASPGHPTFETLQDAIIREINSHDAFQSVPVPTTDPPFTPPASDNSFDETILLPPPGPSGPRKDQAEKEGQLSKKIRKGSFARNRGKSISSTKGGEKNLKKESHSFMSKRRHTYAQPPTPDWLHSLQPPVNLPAGATFLAPINSRPQLPPRHPYHVKRNSDPVPPSPNFMAFIPAESQPEYPGYQVPTPIQFAFTSAGILSSNRGEGRKEQARAQEFAAVDANNVMYILNPKESVTPLDLINASQQGCGRRQSLTLMPVEAHGSNERSWDNSRTTRVPLRKSSLGSAL
ncbi:hypothetical protein PISL3812_01096 [Talaromyces islandicus]|uniref:Uncharacterized protein n=1 Tax=Talaromyces islandicus TaxID=28573 RepID=A0A0U1LN85_TALIS|nr:hypothetical protein PISL3812_01096 [Talaromyces islandicus]